MMKDNSKSNKETREDFVLSLMHFRKAQIVETILILYVEEQRRTAEYSLLSLKWAVVDA